MIYTQTRQLKTKTKKQAGENIHQYLITDAYLCVMS